MPPARRGSGGPGAWGGKAPPCPAWSCTDLHGLLQRRGSATAQEPTCTLVLSRSAGEGWTSIRIFCSCFAYLECERARFSQEDFCFVSLFFGSRESERSAFSTDLFGRQEASKECERERKEKGVSKGKSNRYSINCVLYATTHIILVLPCLRQNVGSTIRKLGYQIFWVLGLGKVVVFCFVFFVCVTRFQCHFAMCFPSNAKSIAGQVDF